MNNYSYIDNEYVLNVEGRDSEEPPEELQSGDGSDKADQGPGSDVDNAHPEHILCDNRGHRQGDRGSAAEEDEAEYEQTEVSHQEHAPQTAPLLTQSRAGSLVIELRQNLPLLVARYH